MLRIMIECFECKVRLECFECKTRRTLRGVAWPVPWPSFTGLARELPRKCMGADPALPRLESDHELLAGIIKFSATASKNEVKSQ